MKHYTFHIGGRGVNLEITVAASSFEEARQKVIDGYRFMSKIYFPGVDDVHLTLRSDAVSEENCDDVKEVEADESAAAEAINEELATEAHRDEFASDIANMSA